MKKSKILFLIGGAILLIIITLIKHSREENYANEFYSHKILLKGVIQKKQFIQKDYGFYSIDIKDCNVKDFDLRNNGEDYKLIIKGAKAELIERNYSIVEVNDSIIIDFANRNIVLFRNDKLFGNFGMDQIMPTKWYPEEIKKLHEL